MNNGHKIRLVGVRPGPMFTFENSWDPKKQAENRKLFREWMDEMGEEVLDGKYVTIEKSAVERLFGEWKDDNLPEGVIAVLVVGGSLRGPIAKLLFKLAMVLLKRAAKKSGSGVDIFE